MLQMMGIRLGPSTLKARPDCGDKWSGIFTSLSEQTLRKMHIPGWLISPGSNLPLANLPKHNEDPQKDTS